MRAGTRRRHNWLQLARFCAVGASGYVVNLVVFAVAVKLIGVPYIAAATVAFCFAVANNFLWNRYWTFDARAGRMRLQTARFLAVSVAAFAAATGMLDGFVVLAGMPTIAAQALSLIAVTPISFAGNKLWTFQATSAQRAPIVEANLAAGYATPD